MGVGAGNCGLRTTRSSCAITKAPPDCCCHVPSRLLLFTQQAEPISSVAVKDDK